MDDKALDMQVEQIAEAKERTTAAQARIDLAKSRQKIEAGHTLPLFSVLQIIQILDKKL